MNHRIPRIACWTRLPLAREEILAAMRAQDGIELVVVESVQELLPQLAALDALILHSAPLALAREVVAAMPTAGRRLRWMHFLTAGRDGFEAAGLPPDIAVTHVPGASAPAVAEHALALLLALCRRIPQAQELMRQSRWEREQLAPFSSLEGLRVAVLGTGAIGGEIARRLRAFGAVPVGVSRAGGPQSDYDETHPVAALHAALGTSRALVVAVPLTPATRHLVDARALAALPRGALVVNVARGAVIDQGALCAALHGGHLGGAALDVTDPEPPPADDPLWSCPNLVLTPHVAVAGSAGTTRRVVAGTLDNVRRFAAGEPLLGLARRQPGDMP